MKEKNIIIEPSNSMSFRDNIQEAIIECYEVGGGVIDLLPGVHRSKPIILKSNIHLNVMEGAILYFSTEFSDYDTVFTRWEGTECNAVRAMIFADSCHNIKIYGNGIIDGLGETWWSAYKDLRNGIINENVKLVQDKIEPLNKGIKAGSGGGGIETNFLRPSLVQLKNCKNVDILDVTLKNSAFWNTHILYSSNILINGVKFQNPSNAPNTDGLDIDSSSNVIVDKCKFDVGDDCLCLKSGMDADGYRVGKSTHHITVSNCFMNKGHGGIVIGSETSGGIHDIDISNCTMTGTDRGIRLKTRRRRCGLIKNININEIKMDGVISPVVMNMYYRCGSKEEDFDYLASLEEQEVFGYSTPAIENVVITNITATNVSSASAFFFGLPESKIKNLELSNFNVSSNKNKIDEYPAMDLFNTKTEQCSFYINNVRNLQYSNIVVNGKKVNL